MSRFTAAALT